MNGLFKRGCHSWIKACSKAQKLDWPVYNGSSKIAEPRQQEQNCVVGLARTSGIWCVRGPSRPNVEFGLKTEDMRKPKINSTFIKKIPKRESQNHSQKRRRRFDGEKYHEAVLSIFVSIREQQHVLAHQSCLNNAKKMEEWQRWKKSQRCENGQAQDTNLGIP